METSRSEKFQGTGFMSYWLFLPQIYLKWSLLPVTFLGFNKTALKVFLQSRGFLNQAKIIPQWNPEVLLSNGRGRLALIVGLLCVRCLRHKRAGFGTGCRSSQQLSFSPLKKKHFFLFSFLRFWPSFEKCREGKISCNFSACIWFFLHLQRIHLYRSELWSPVTHSTLASVCDCLWRSTSL